MARVKYGKQSIEGVSNVIVNSDNIITDRGTIPLGKVSVLRIEVRGLIDKVKSNNCCSIKGDVYACQVGNYVQVDGMLMSCRRSPTEQSRVQVDREAFVFFGNDEKYWDAFKHGFPLSIAKAKVLHIDGNLFSIESATSNIETHLEVYGKVKMAKVSNILYVRGTAVEAIAPRGVCTMGAKNRPDPRQLYKTKAEMEETIFNNCFGDFFNKR